MYVIENMVSIDTIKAFTSTLISPDSLVKMGWRRWKNVNDKEQYTIKKGDFFFRYIPAFRYLCVQFSASKVTNGINSKPFAFSDTNKLINMVNSILPEVVPDNIFNINTDFADWTVNRLDIFVDYNTESEENKLQYLKCISRLDFGRCHNTIYKTSNHAKSISSNYNIYSKSDEMIAKHYKNSDESKTNQNQYPNSDPGSNVKSVASDELFIYKSLVNTLRLEVQLKKSALIYILNKSRKVRDIVSVDICKQLFLRYMKRINLDLPFLVKSELFQKIRNTYSDRVSTRLIEFVEDYNELDTEVFIQKYKKSTVYNYFKMVKSIGANPVYLCKRPAKYIDFKKIAKAIKLVIAPDKDNSIELIVLLRNSFYLEYDTYDRYYNYFDDG